MGPDRVGALAFGPDPDTGPQKLGVDGWEPYIGRRLSLEVCVDGVEDAVKNKTTETIRAFVYVSIIAENHNINKSHFTYFQDFLSKKLRIT